MNNILDLTKPENQQFIASVIAALCEDGPITIELQDIEKFWCGEIQRLQYDMVSDLEGRVGFVTFSLKDKNEHT